jgi:Xaa-Pro aminopeptidase
MAPLQKRVKMNKARMNKARIVRETGNMSIQTQAELEKLRSIGRIVRLALARAAAAVRPGVTTGELSEMGAPCGGTIRPAAGAFE